MQAVERGVSGPSCISMAKKSTNPVGMTSDVLGDGCPRFFEAIELPPAK